MPFLFKMNNEIIVRKDVEDRLRKFRTDHKKSPIPQNLRDKLVELKGKTIGNLRKQVKTIKDLKRAEFEKNNSDIINTELVKKMQPAHEFVIEMQKLVDKIKELENEKPVGVERNSYTYDQLNRMFTISNSSKRELKNEIIKSLFAKWTEKFDGVAAKLQEYEDLYEEVVLFGDVELVKEVYYKLKKAERLVNSLETLKV